MVAGKFASEHGAIGSDGKFAIFPDEETGRKAMEALIKGKFANSTIDGTVTGWAPPSDGNDTAGYQKMVRGITRLPGNTVIRTLTPEQIRGVGQAIRRVEKWAPGTIVRGKK